MFDAEDPLDQPVTQVELDLHSIDGAPSHIRQIVGRDPSVAGLYRADFAEIAAEFTDLARH